MKNLDFPSAANEKTFLQRIDSLKSASKKFALFKNDFIVVED